MYFQLQLDIRSLFLCLSVSAYLPVSPSVCLCVCVCVSLSLSVPISACQLARLSSSVCLSAFLNLSISACQPARLSSSACLPAFVCLPISACQPASLSSSACLLCLPISACQPARLSSSACLPAFVCLPISACQPASLSSSACLLCLPFSACQPARLCLPQPACLSLSACFYAPLPVCRSGWILIFFNTKPLSFHSYIFYLLQKTSQKESSFSFSARSNSETLGLTFFFNQTDQPEEQILQVCPLCEGTHRKGLNTRHPTPHHALGFRRRPEKRTAHTTLHTEFWGFADDLRKELPTRHPTPHHALGFRRRPEKDGQLRRLHCTGDLTRPEGLVAVEEEKRIESQSAAIKPQCFPKTHPLLWAYVSEMNAAFPQQRSR